MPVPVPRKPLRPKPRAETKTTAETTSATSVIECGSQGGSWVLEDGLNV